MEKAQDDDQDNTTLVACCSSSKHGLLHGSDIEESGGRDDDAASRQPSRITPVVESQETHAAATDDDMVDIVLSDDDDIGFPKPVSSKSAAAAAAARPSSFSSPVAASHLDFKEQEEETDSTRVVQEGQDSLFDDDDDAIDHERRIAELAEFVRTRRHNDDGNNTNNDDVADRELLLLRLHDFYRARFLRRQKYKYQPWGIFGLFSHLADIRLDLEWAEDAAWRRQHGEPFFAWVDFDKLHSKVYNFPLFTIFIMILSTILLLVSIGLNGDDGGWTIEPVRVNPMLGPKPLILVRLGALVAVQIVEQNEWYRLFLPMILHAGIIHYVINMLALLFLGTAVERVHGAFKTAFIFVVASVGGNLASALMMPHAISIGASGGIFGLLGVCLADICVNWKLLTLRRADDENDNGGGFPYARVLFFLALDIIISLGIGLTPFIDNFAHVGGFFYGICFGIAFLTQSGNSGFFGAGGNNKTPNRSRFGFCGFRVLTVIIATALLITKTVLLSQSDTKDPIPCKGCRYISCAPFPFWQEDKWWYCDSCEHSSGVIHYSKKSSDLELFCPFGGDIVTIDLMTKNADPDQVGSQLTTYCREYC